MADCSMEVCGEPSDDEELISYLQTSKYSFATDNEEHSTDMSSKHVPPEGSWETKGFESETGSDKEHTCAEQSLNSMDKVGVNYDSTIAGNIKEQKPMKQNVKSKVVNTKLVSDAHNRSFKENAGDIKHDMSANTVLMDMNILNNKLSRLQPYPYPGTTGSHSYQMAGTSGINMISKNERAVEHLNIKFVSQMGDVPDNDSIGHCDRNMAVDKELKVFLKNAEESCQPEKEKHFIITENNWNALCLKVSRMINCDQSCKVVARKDGSGNIDQEDKVLCGKTEQENFNNRPPAKSVIESSTSSTGRFVRRNNKLVFERFSAVSTEKSLSTDFSPDFQEPENLDKYCSQSKINNGSILLTEDEKQVILKGDIDMKEAFDTTNCQVIAFSTNNDGQMYDKSGARLSQKTCYSPEFSAQPVVFNIDEAGELQRVNYPSPKWLLKGDVTKNIGTKGDVEEHVRFNLEHLSTNSGSEEDLECFRNPDSVRTKNGNFDKQHLSDSENIFNETKHGHEGQAKRKHSEITELEGTNNDNTINRHEPEKKQRKSIKQSNSCLETKNMLLKTIPCKNTYVQSKHTRETMSSKRAHCQKNVQRGKSDDLSEAKSKPDEVNIKSKADSGVAITEVEIECRKAEFMHAIELDTQLNNTNGKFSENVNGRSPSNHDSLQKEENPEDSEIEIESDLEDYFSKVTSPKESNKVSVKMQADLDSSETNISPQQNKFSKRENIFEHKPFTKRDTLTKSQKDASAAELEMVVFGEDALSMKQDSSMKKTWREKYSKIQTTRSRMRNERRKKTLEMTTEQNNEDKQDSKCFSSGNQASRKNDLKTIEGNSNLNCIVLGGNLRGISRDNTKRSQLNANVTSKTKRTLKIRFDKTVSFGNVENPKGKYRDRVVIYSASKQIARAAGLHNKAQKHGKVEQGQQRKISKVNKVNFNHDTGKLKTGVRVSHGIKLKNVINIEKADNTSATSKPGKSYCQNKRTDCRMKTTNDRKKKILPLSESTEAKNIHLPRMIKLRKQRKRHEQNKWKELLTCEMMDIQRDIEQLDHEVKCPINVRKVIKEILKTAKSKSKHTLTCDSVRKRLSSSNVSNENKLTKLENYHSNADNTQNDALQILEKSKMSSNSRSKNICTKVLTGAILEKLHERNKFSLQSRQIYANVSKNAAKRNMQSECESGNVHGSVLKFISAETSRSSNPVKSVIGLTEGRHSFETDRTCFEIHESPSKIGVQCFQQFVLNSPQRESTNGDWNLRSTVLDVKHVLPTSTVVSPSKAADKLKNLLLKANTARKLILN